MIKIALAGNPNSGKTTLFNALTGSNQYVGNWPGVTVEKKEGYYKNNEDVIITDLPGVYSLSPYTLEETVARDYLINEKPDVILNIVDGCNLERNLYLTIQLCELSIPVIVAVNMMDIVEKNGDIIDAFTMSKHLGCRVFKISAIKEASINEAVEAAIKAAKSASLFNPKRFFSPLIENALFETEKYLNDSEFKYWYAIKLFERDKQVLKKVNLSKLDFNNIERIISKTERETYEDSESIIINERYAFIEKLIGKCYIKKNKSNVSVSDKIDKIVTNRYLAFPIFIVIMFLVYFLSVSTVGKLLGKWINEGLFENFLIPAFKNVLLKINCADWLFGLLTEGILAGLGSVLSFFPQIIMLFLILGFLESSGYMARIAFILDKVFRKFGLSGKSFIPILIGTGCSVPGIMASRTIENESERKMTVLTTSFMPCGAKLPVIALIAGAVFKGEWWVAVGAYFLGIMGIICSGVILKKAKIFKENSTVFIMELPAYHMPKFKNIYTSTKVRSLSFIKKAASIILLSSIFIWFIKSFGVVDRKLMQVDNMDKSLLAFLGMGVGNIFKPLGFGNWKFAVSCIMGLIAKENIVSTLGILYGFSQGLQNGVWGSLAQNLSPLSACSFLAFNLLCAPCVAAMGAIKREMNSTKWFLFAIGYQTVFAYSVSLCIFQFGSLINGGRFTIYSLFALILFLGFMYFLIKRYKTAEVDKQ